MAQIPYDDRDGFIWMDGKMLPWREAKVHFLTHALHYGTQVFEGERAYNGRIFKSEKHSERLLNSGELIHMPIPYSVQQIEDIKYECLKANGLDSAYIRAAAWRGSEQMGIDVAGTEVHLAVAAWDWGSYFDPEVKKKGISLGSVQWRKPAPECAPVHSKSASLYNLSCMAKFEAKKAGFTDALMLDHEGFVAESTGANLFAIKDGQIFTPMADRFLNGLTRQTVIELANDLGIKVTETRIKPEELETFEEIFLTGTAAELTAVGKINDLSYQVGPITQKLQDSYTDLVNSAPAGAKAVNS